MGFIPFYKVDPELAERETRHVTVLKEHDGLPAGTYRLIETYCTDPTCDCRQVMFEVYCDELQRRGCLATIGYDYGGDQRTGPYLDRHTPQSEWADVLLKLVTTVIQSDPRYVARLQDHTDLVKEAATDLRHPGHVGIRRWEAGGGSGGMRFNRPVEKVPRGAPCPCGSGKKYKRCCLGKGRLAAREEDLGG